LLLQVGKTFFWMNELQKCTNAQVNVKNTQFWIDEG
jgi:hypothetical protein